MKRNLLAICALVCTNAIFACTGIGLTAQDHSRIVARTSEWSATPVNHGYMIVPRGYEIISQTPEGENGLKIKGQYGYVAVFTEVEQVVIEGMNECGLNVGLFFFPDYGQYSAYTPADHAITLNDMQLVNWALANFKTIDEVKEALAHIRVCSANPQVQTVHWRISEPTGRTVVLEFTNGEAHWFEDDLAVLANSPGFEWHLTNLMNYVNLTPGAAMSYDLTKDIHLTPLSSNSAMLGLPGDYTSPSRFVRAAFMAATAPVWPNAEQTVIQAFHLLNTCDIPIGLQRNRVEGQTTADTNPANTPSATHFFTVSDLTNRKFYYHTEWNMNIRCIDLNTINFKKVKYQTAFIDNDHQQPVEMVEIK